MGIDKQSVKVPKDLTELSSVLDEELFCPTCEGPLQISIFNTKLASLMEKRFAFAGSIVLTPKEVIVLLAALEKKRFEIERNNAAIELLQSKLTEEEN